MRAVLALLLAASVSACGTVDPDLEAPRVIYSVYTDASEGEVAYRTPSGEHRADVAGMRWVPVPGEPMPRRVLVVVAEVAPGFGAHVAARTGAAACTRVVIRYEGVAGSARTLADREECPAAGPVEVSVTAIVPAE